ncbi:MAG: general secretion pathway protein GspK [Gemmatimonadales bacterium]
MPVQPSTRLTVGPSASGFALLAVLWLITAAGLVVATTLALSGMDQLKSRNRIILTRAEWAAEACTEIVQAEWGDTTKTTAPSTAPTDSVDLGRDTWCTWRLENPAARVNLNLADAAMLRQLLGSDSLTDAVLDWRDPDDDVREAGAESGWYLAHRRRPPRNAPFASVEELALVKGMDSAAMARAGSLFTVRGTGLIDVNQAPDAVLEALPGIEGEARFVIHARRQQGRRLQSLDELLSLLSASGQAPILARYADLQSRLTFQPGQLIVQVTAGVRGYAVSAHVTLTAVPLPARLAVVRRETW